MKILSLTSTRSDYDLMSALYKKISKDDYFSFSLVVSGTHLSDFHQQTIKYIIDDDIQISAEIPTVSIMNDPENQILSCSILIKLLEPIIKECNPDFGFVVGDREDAFAFALCLTYLDVPFIHFYSGDQADDGHVDNKVRHAISKLATCHFVSIPEHFKRLKAIGEEENRIKVVGNLSLDNILNETFIDKPKLVEEILGSKKILNSKIAFLLYHPIKNELKEFNDNFPLILDYLSKLDYYIFCALPNHDPGHLKVEEIIRKQTGRDNYTVIPPVSRSLFVNLIRHSDLVLGNSSFGILESASFGVPVINFGIRQSGRMAPKNVLFCELDLESIKHCIDEVNSRHFLTELVDLKNPYGDGHSSERVIRLLKTLDVEKLLYPKKDPLALNE